MNELALFAGAGGGILGGHLLGWRTVCAVEYNAYARSILLARQNDRTLAPFPVWDDVRTFDGKSWRGIVDVVSGGFPCQDISAAGKGAGIDGERSGLWGEMARIVCEVQPRYVYVENSPMLTGRGLGRVLGDLAEMGFDAEWGVVSAADTGAAHLRERIWIVAHAMRFGQFRSPGIEFSSHHRIGLAEACGTERGQVTNATQPGCEDVADCLCEGSQVSGEITIGQNREQGRGRIAPSRGWPIEPELDRVAHGLAHRVDRLKAIGNGQVSRVAATAWRLLA